MFVSKKSLFVLLSCCLASSFAQTSTVSGTQTAGPSSQGSCNLSGTGWLCSNGAYCTWSDSAASFSCIGGTGTVVEAEGPPGRTCIPHQGHFDCTDDGEESTCEQEDGVWVCTSYGSSSHGGEGAAAGGSTCIVHGGHTHGDCADSCNGVDLGEYDLPLHIASLFIVMAGSIIGVMLPIVAAKLVHTKTFGWFFFVARHFGTGVILSTAFIHLLYHSFIMFGNACIGELHFEPAAAAISLAGLYIVFFFDYTVMRWLARRADRDRAALGHSGSDDGSMSAPSSPKATGEKTSPVLGGGHDHTDERGEVDYASKQAHFDVYILEAGIIFHSIMIGVSLGTSGGDQWKPLFIAIIFHQFFEGLALGSRIGLLKWKSYPTLKKWGMGILFSFITGLGIAIGIGAHASYNPNSGAALLSIGVLDAISAGILIYAGIVELLVHDFLRGELARSGKVKTFLAFASLLGGTICMSILGKWA